MKIKLTLAYDGTNYHGWQSQKNAVTIQDLTEHALSSLFNQRITIMGASRTDAGVHALGQAASFSIEQMNIPLNKLHLPINAYLPDDIKVLSAERVGETFHPIFDAKKKTYQYQIQNGAVENPLTNRYSEFEGTPLCFEKMVAAKEHIIGRHDFKTFCASGSTVKTTVRTVHALSLSKDGEMITMTITGNGFLYNMVRIIAGTLIAVGKGKIEPDAVKDIIQSRNRTSAGKTASARGLTLMKVYY